MTFDMAFLISLSQIMWINILLSGDNALIIALACRDLPPQQKRMGMILGAGAAVGLRILFTFLLAYLLDTPMLRLIGGLLLFWVSVKLIIDDADSHSSGIVSSDRLFQAVRTIAIADIVMSLDNVLAIAAIAKDNMVLMVIGLVISIPLIVAGSGVVMYILNRFPLLVWAGAGLLGWVAASMMLADPVLTDYVDQALIKTIHLPINVAGVLFVLGIGYLIKQQRKKDATETA
jgi:YjbE family integral membrane protein